MSTYMGFGTHLRGFSVRRPDGTHDATEWVVVPAIALTPIVLLNVYGGDAADEFGSNLLVLGWLVGVPVGILTLSKRIRRLPT